MTRATNLRWEVRCLGSIAIESSYISILSCRSYQPLRRFRRTPSPIQLLKLAFLASSRNAMLVKSENGPAMHARAVYLRTQFFC